MTARHSSGRWREVTRNEPCLACGKSDWCAWTPDGALLKCERTSEAPAGMAKVKDADGGALFRDMNGSPTVAPPSSKSARAYGTAAEAVAVLERRLGARSAWWTYTDAAGQAVGMIVRWNKAAGKVIRPVARYPDGWRIAAMPKPRPLYRLPELAAATRVYLCEGEKAADGARALGLTATTSAHGAKASASADWTPLAGKDMVVLPDNDGDGRYYAESVQGILSGLVPPARVRLLHLPGLPEGGDIVEFVQPRLAAGLAHAAIRGEIEGLANAAPVRQAPADGSDSIRAPIAKGSARIEFRPLPLSQIGPSVPPQWVWPGYIALGHATLLIALWKAGKTTLVAHVLRDLGLGAGLADGGRSVTVLVISEESSSLWATRRDELGIGDHVHLQCRPFRGRPSASDWADLTELISREVENEGYGLVVLDTLAGLWPVADENNAADVLTALAPLARITSLGSGLLLVHHPRKGDAGEGQAARGSGALPASVDIVLEMRRHSKDERSDRRRVLTAYSRFDDTPPEAVLELGDDGYRVVGDRAEVREADRMQQIEMLLPGAPPGLTPEEVQAAWPSAPKPGVRTIEVQLGAGHASGRWARAGTGRRGDPYRYWIGSQFDSRRLDPLRARIESDGLVPGLRLAGDLGASP